ncbi:ABC transporter related protein [Planctopirus limnophila DSM 3776]|uniref:ABC transporter related protein n=1 Tax=Planctopirus limnophila (strain ATCC 43296 / DSM 3776 / IFAM 1008 / Mu 290) TaxID=521674 RepID=D5ST76_PLAL2|nr:ATP-binding cassette domain-containing protein [Planctopirus limnophila]ADG66844.1 ABC transporter related protein [Planctopirus limnophila DSM 3776]
MHNHSTNERQFESPPEIVLELDGLEQRLYDPERGEEFTVRVSQPLRIASRNLVALLGPSGCGKTTLLTILGLLRAPSHPQTLRRFVMRTPNPNGFWEEHDLRSLWLSGAQRSIERLRRQRIGFALQSGELLPALTVRENIATPLMLNGVTSAVCRTRVDELLESFALNGAPRANGKGRRIDQSRINKLSGGEYQRVALARAIVHRPTLLYVDEPTSALNRDLAWGALQQVRSLQCSPNSHGAAVMITHDEQLAAAFADMIVRMAPVPGQSAGEVVEIVANVPSAAAEVPETTLTESAT